MLDESSQNSISGEGGVEELFEVGTVILSVSNVRVEIIDVREPSRSLSRRECSLEAIEDSIGEPFVAAPTSDCTPMGKLASFGELPGVLCGDRCIPWGTREGVVS
jgi:hypothetical protein